MDNSIDVSTLIHADIDVIWDAYNNPEHIKEWYRASDAWYCPKSQSIFQVWGRFTHTMSSHDGEMHFDFEWTYTEIIENELVAYILDDERKVQVQFTDEDSLVKVTLNFEPDDQSDIQGQTLWWEAILSNFAWYAESL